MDALLKILILIFFSGDIIHMGSVAVGPDHRDRYFVLFPQTLVILSVSQRMSAFIYEVNIFNLSIFHVTLRNFRFQRENCL